MVRFLAFTLAISLASSLASAASTSPRLSRRVLHERRNSVPTGWSLHRRADPDAVLPLNIALRQSNIDKLDEYLLELFDPESHQYGQLWSPARVAQTFRPSRETIDTVHTWLVDDGVDKSRIRFSKDSSYIQLNVSVAEAEKLLAAEYYVYQHEETGVQHVGCHHGYRLPEHVSTHIDVVTPTVEFGGITLGATLAKRSRAAPGTGKMQRPKGPPKTPMAAEAVATDLAHCDTQVTPDCLRALYNFQPNLVATDKNKVAVVELGDQTFVANDLNVYFQQFAPDQVGTLPTLISIDGGTTDFTQTDPSIIGESNLDFELIMGLLGKKQEILLYQVGGSGSFNLLLDAIDGSFCTFDGGDDPVQDFVLNSTTEDCGTKPPAFVVSVSYAGAEDLGIQYMTRQCIEYGKLSMMGMTFLFASGDNGVASNGDDFCFAANGSEVVGSGNFAPNFPASCPYVTAVGATQLDSGKSVTDPESATSTFSSGGGFSNVFARPRYQDYSVRRYLSKSAPPFGMDVFNRSGRGIPDVAANGSPTLVVIDGNLTLSGGTSASTPIFAAMVAAVNDARLAVGKKPVGFINPALYSHLFAGVFHDITNGSNPGCGTGGFPTARGWDPVTGLGTVNFQQLLTRFLWLP